MKKKALQLKLPRLLQEGMVLQRGKPVTLWGEGLPGSRVEINFQGSKRETVVGKDSRWQLLTDTLQTGGPFPMEIRRHSISLGQISHRCSEFSIWSTELSKDNLGNFRVSLSNLNRIL